MREPEFSVVVPAYNHGRYLPEAIRSVFGQTFSEVEVVIVNDGSTDDTAEVVAGFQDPRIKYLEQENRGASAARNVGMRASSGRFIAFLDADDSWHPDKLRMHAAFLGAHPEVGVSFNARFELEPSTGSIRGLWRPPLSVTLSDLVRGFPFSPSDMVIRRDWAFHVNGFDERYVFYGDDLDFYCRLALAGCEFAGVNRALNYRRYHSRRIISNLTDCVRAALSPLERTFSDPRCPVHVSGLRGEAYSNHYIWWAIRALTQGETALGQDLLREAASLNPIILAGDRCKLLKELLWSSIADEAVDHEGRLQYLFAQLPPEMSALSDQRDWAVGYGSLLKAARAVTWGRVEEGREQFDRAGRQGARADRAFLRAVAYQLLEYESEFGTDSAREALQTMSSCLARIGDRSHARRLEGEYLMGQAYRDRHAGRYARVPIRVMRAFAKNPVWLSSRGAHSTLFRSMVGMLSHRFR